MKKIDATIARIKTLYNVKTRIELCNKMEISLGTYDTWISRDKIPDKRLQQIAEEYNIYIEWLKTGVGNKNRIEPQSEIKELLSTLINTLSIQNKDKRVIKISTAFDILDENEKDNCFKEIMSLITKRY